MIKTSLKTASLLPLLALLVSACQPLPRVSAPPAAAADSAKTTLQNANKALIQRFYDEVANAKNMDSLKELMDPKVVPHEYGLVMANEAQIFTGMPDLKATVSLWVLQDDLVTSVVNLKGTQTGEFLGVAPTGKTVDVTNIDIWRIKNGKIVEVWHNFPISDMLAQISPPAKK